ncbi:MAG: TonB-dependent receptor, partial [Gemmatimonadetes bacterium]|nr:TonB-dependent receptor [Gemmatimonadota bacterium]
MTSGAIGGLVTDSAGRPLPSAQITVTNDGNGFRASAVSRANGKYLVASLEPGGPYTVQARAIGYAPQVTKDVYVTLSQTQAVDFKFTPRVVTLSAVAVTSTQQTLEFGPSRQGTQTRVSDTALARLPNLNRNVTDFVKLTPQVTVNTAGNASPAGQNNRFLNVQVDGASIANRFGLGASPEVGAQVSGRAITMDAVKEYQVVLTPFDVRQGGFTGALLNAVTKGGTNEFHGSLFYYTRDQSYGADDPVLRATPFYRNQWGATLGGPIIKDRLHFFGSMEYQRQLAPAA